MFVQPFPSGPFSTNAYLVVCPETKHAAIIDPAPESSSLIFAAIEKQDLNPDKILITHSHWDHIADTAEIKKKYNIPVYVHQEDKENLEHPGSDGLPCWIHIPSVMASGALQEGQIIPIGNLQLVVIHTPGHTPGGVCFYCQEHQFIISGDTLFKGTIGNLSFPTARPNLMWVSLKKLAALPPDTVVYPGHGPATTIGSEKWLSQAENLFG